MSEWIGGIGNADATCSQVRQNYVYKRLSLAEYHSAVYTCIVVVIEV